MKVEIGPYLDFKRKANRRKKRIIKVRIDNHDSWSLDHTLALIIAPALAKFDKGDGTPASMFPPKILFDSSNVKTKAYRKIEKAAEKKWNDILTAMHWSFDQIARNEPNGPKFPLKSSRDLAELNRKRTVAETSKIKKHIVEYAVYRKRIKHGLELFGKYYQDLWN